MERTGYTISAAALAAAWLLAGTAGAQTSQRDRQTTNPTPMSDKQETVSGAGKETPASGGALRSPWDTQGSNAPTAMSGKTSGQDVMAAQQALREKGFNPGPIDGIMGNRTREALKNFQQTNKLRVTGTLNQQTAERLGVEFGGQSDQAAEINKPERGVSTRDRRTSDQPTPLGDTPRDVGEKK